MDFLRGSLRILKPTRLACHSRQYQSDDSENMGKSHSLSIRFEGLHRLWTIKMLCTIPGSIRMMTGKKLVNPHNLPICFEGLRRLWTIKVSWTIRRKKTIHSFWGNAWIANRKRFVYCTGQRKTNDMKKKGRPHNLSTHFEGCQRYRVYHNLYPRGIVTIISSISLTIQKSIAIKWRYNTSYFFFTMSTSRFLLWYMDWR